jgi:hypothetical protein
MLDAGAEGGIGVGLTFTNTCSEGASLGVTDFVSSSVFAAAALHTFANYCRADCRSGSSGMTLWLNERPLQALPSRSAMTGVGAKPAAAPHELASAIRLSGPQAAVPLSLATRAKGEAGFTR